MTQYIDKSEVVKEIKKLESRFQNGSDEDYADGYHYSLELVKRILDTLEVKEVDLEKEYEDFVIDDPILGNFITNDTMGMMVAKHFFEVGLKTKGE